MKTKITAHVFRLRFEKDAEKKAADEAKLFGETMPKIFGLWESRMSAKFLTGDKVIINVRLTLAPLGAGE